MARAALVLGLLVLLLRDGAYRAMQGSVLVLLDHLLLACASWIDEGDELLAVAGDGVDGGGGEEREEGKALGRIWERPEEACEGVDRDGRGEVGWR